MSVATPDLDPHRRSSSTVVPTRTLSPGCTMAGAASRWSFTKVPFVEPRSSTYHEPFLREDPRVLLRDEGVVERQLALGRAADRPCCRSTGTVRGFALRCGSRPSRGRAASPARRRPRPSSRRAARRRAPVSTRQPAHRPSHRAPDEQQQQREQPVLQADSANGVTLWASVETITAHPSGTRARWCRS